MKLHLLLKCEDALLDWGVSGWPSEEMSEESNLLSEGVAVKEAVISAFSMLWPVLRFFVNRQHTEEVTEETGNFSEKQAVKLETTEETTNETTGQIEAPSTHWNAQKISAMFQQNFSAAQ